MKRVIRFSRARYWFFAISTALILAGVVGYVANRGLNLGVDFRAGVAFQFQVAPASFAVQYTGPDKVEISIPAGEEALTSPGDIIFTVTSSKDGSQKTIPFRYSGFTTVRDLADAITKQVAGVAVDMKGDPSASPSQLLVLPRPANITNAPFTINRTPGPGRGVETNIAEVRSLLAPMGDFSLQAVGAPTGQEFITRIPVKPGMDERSFLEDSQKNLLQALEARFGAGQVIIKSTEFVGARMAQGLASQTVWLVLIAVLGIFIYMFFRFRPWIYGAAAVIGILHDALVMLSFDAVFRVEIDAATIAAILTILGYSINDTIVNFDRARENVGLMRGESLRTILDTSVTQTLSRTFITSGATLLTVIALFVLTSGSIKNFALNMIVGIVEGTYSTFFSAFLVIEWVNWRDRRKKSDTLAKYGITVAERPHPILAAEAEAELPEDEGEEVPEGFVPGELAAEAPGAGAVPVTAVGPSAAGASAVQEGASAAANGPQGAASPSPRPAAPLNVPFPGQTGSRKHKKHRRHHH
jgi:preprotein translocase subunit SecF